MCPNMHSPKHLVENEKEPSEMVREKENYEQESCRPVRAQVVSAKNAGKSLRP